MTTMAQARFTFAIILILAHGKVCIFHDLLEYSKYAFYILNMSLVVQPFFVISILCVASFITLGGV